jgi:predicted nucleotidyltransferase
MKHDRIKCKTAPPSIELLASPALRRLVTHFALHPRADLHFHALKRATSLPNRSLQLELVRLRRLGLITRKPDGRLVRYIVQADESRWKVLRELVRQFVEPAEVLRVALAQVTDITAAFIYGSFARRGDVHADSDIDLFVVSETVDEPLTRLALAREVLEVSGFLGREVNVSRYTPVQLARKVLEPSRFVTSVLSGEKDWIVGDQKHLSAAISARRRAPRGEILA